MKTLTAPAASPNKNVRQAFYDLVHRHSGAASVPDLAAKLGVSPAVLYNKANVDDAHHKATLDDAVLAQIITGDRDVVCAMALVLDGVFVDLRAAEKVSDDALLELVADWMKEQGEFFVAFQTALADGTFSGREVDQLRGEANQVVSAVLKLVERIGGLA